MLLLGWNQKLQLDSAQPFGGWVGMKNSKPIVLKEQYDEHLYTDSLIYVLSQRLCMCTHVFSSFFLPFCLFVLLKHLEISDIK